MLRHDVASAIFACDLGAPVVAAAEVALLGAAHLLGHEGAGAELNEMMDECSLIETGFASALQLVALDEANVIADATRLAASLADGFGRTNVWNRLSTACLDQVAPGWKAPPDESFEARIGDHRTALALLAKDHFDRFRDLAVAVPEGSPFRDECLGIAAVNGIDRGLAVAEGWGTLSSKQLERLERDEMTPDQLRRAKLLSPKD